VAPLALAAVFSLTIQSFSAGSQTFQLGLVNLDHGKAAQAFETSLVVPVEGQNIAKFHRVATVAQVKKLLDAKTVDAAIVLPRGLTASEVGGRRVQIEVLGDINRQIGTLVARSLANSFASGLRTFQLVGAAEATAHPLLPGGLETVLQSSHGAGSPIKINDVSARQKVLQPGTYFAAAMAVFFLFFTVQFGISSLLDERRDGTLARMLAAPIRRSSVLLGKALTSLALGIASMTVLAVATHFALGAHWGNPLGVAILILFSVVAATAITALVTTAAKTQEQANAWLSIVAVVLGMLGGSFFPVANAGGVLAALSKLTPHSWFLSGLEDLSSGGGLSVVVKPVLALTLISAISGSLALVRIRKLIEP
jgi:ABC-2 type transport system permease protein